MRHEENKKEQANEYEMNPGLPVQQVEIDGEKPSKKEVKEAIKEINPDQNSLGQRG